jgi:hypothetical protein
VALKQAKYSDSSHLLLKEEDWKVFGGLDPSAIRISSLKEHGKLFEQSVKCGLNIMIIDPSMVIMYLRRMLQSQEASITDHSFLRTWLLKLWKWLASSHLFTNVISNPAYRKLPTMPLRNGEIIPLESAIFNTNGTTESLLHALEHIGLNFIHDSFPSHIRSRLRPSLLSPFDLSSVLENLDIGKAEILPDTVVNTLRELLSKYLPASDLSRGQKEAAMHLPIYNVLSLASENSNYTKKDVSKGPLCNSHSIKCLPGDIPLPVIPGTLFLQAEDYNMVKYIRADVQSLSKEKTLLLAIKELPNQQRFRVRTLIEYINTKQSYISPLVLQTLLNTPFLITGGSKDYATPTTLLDPTCKAASLYSPTDRWIPNDDAVTIKALQNLKAFRITLTPEMAEERILFISGQSDSLVRHKRAMELIRQIQDPYFDISRLRVDLSMKWIPSDGNEVLAPNECYHPRIHPSSLFNRVAKVVQPSLKISPSLQKLLGWHLPLSIEIIVKQFETVIQENTSNETKRNDLLTIILKLGQCVEQLASEDIQRLRSLCSVQCSIPVLPRGCESSKQAFFETDLALNPLYVIDPGLESAKKFLQLLGCRKKYAPFLFFSDLN